MAISVSLNGEHFEQVIYTKEDAFEQLVAGNAGTIFGGATSRNAKADSSACGKTSGDIKNKRGKPC
jgi:hypothetical protein